MRQKGQIEAYDAPRGWGFIASDDRKYFYHVKNSPGFAPVLGMYVEFETAPPFRLGLKEQAINLREVGAQ